MASRATTASSVPSLAASGNTSSMSSPTPKTPPMEAPEVTEGAVETGASTDDTTVKEEPVVKEAEVVEEDPAAAKRAHQLKFLLEKSTLYAKIIGDRMERQQIEKQKQQQKRDTRRANKNKRVAEGSGPVRESTRTRNAADPPAADSASSSKRTGADAKSRRNKRRKVDDNAVDVEQGPKEEPDLERPEEEAVHEEENADEDRHYSFAQPELVTGAKLRDYQLAGVQWMISLYENGLNGILADEMGLGKTLQTISFLAHLRSKGTWGPFLIVCPLSVLHNWVVEFEKFAPSIPVLMYHGNQEERKEIRKYKLPPIYAPRKKGARPSLDPTRTFPIIVTTYEMIVRDRSALAGYDWKFIVVDEGHRLKNLNCRLIRELKTFKSANRMILTGTPLHNNLSELWSLLNFILPDIFDDLDSFQQWFNFTDMSADDGLLDRTSIVHQLHGILKPFLLRRLKVEVEKDLPPKKEYLLYAPLTQQQKDIYQAIIKRDIRKYLIAMKAGDALPDELKDENPKPVVVEEPADPFTRVTRKRAAIDYKIEENDSKYLRDLNDKAASAPPPPSRTQMEEKGRRYRYERAVKAVNNMHLQNMVMQLRKISSHPFLFDWPWDVETGQRVVNDDLVEASGKMLLLNRLLEALFAKKHKVLIFSQFTSMLDVIEDWATVFKGYNICRIDGSTSQQDRRAQMEAFNNGGDDEDAPNLFLLSTRAGGLGINLVAADTVIFFDQDWNPQMDLQAQDRAHRIGQTKPVLVFRLVSQHTVETRILQRATEKRKLEALVIQQGKFGKVVDENGRVLLGRTKHSQSAANLARALLDLEGEEINVAAADDMIISDADLEVLLDRSPAAYAREKGWAAGLGHGDKSLKEQLAKGERTAFEVFVPAKDEASEGLAHMFAGDLDAEEN